MTGKKRQDAQGGVSCDQCIYFHDAAKKGQCRHGAPTRRAMTDGWNDGWPTVKSTEWCGRWTGVDEDGALMTYEEAWRDFARSEDYGEPEEDEGDDDDDE